MHGPDARGDLVTGDVFEDVAVRARPDSLEKVGLLVGHGQHDDTRGWHTLANRLACLDPTAPGHPDVHEDDIGNRRLRALDGGHPVVGFVDDDDVAIELKDGAKSLTEQRVVVGDQHPDRVFRGPAIGHLVIMTRLG